MLDINNASMIRDDTNPESEVNNDVGTSMGRNVVLYIFRFEENRSTVFWSIISSQELHFVNRMYKRMALTYVSV